MTDLHPDKLVPYLRAMSDSAWERCDSVVGEAFDQAANTIEALQSENAQMHKDIGTLVFDNVALQSRLDRVLEWAERTDSELTKEADEAATNYDLNIAVGGSDVIAELLALLSSTDEGVSPAAYSKSQPPSP